MGRFFEFISAAGVLILVLFIALAILAVAGVFEPDLLNPPT